MKTHNMIRPKRSLIMATIAIIAASCGSSPTVSSSSSSASISSAPRTDTSIESSSEPSSSSSSTFESSYTRSSEEKPEFVYSDLDLATSVKVKKGAWNFSYNSGSVTSDTATNQAAGTDILIEQNQDMIYEADVKISRGCFHLSFGINDYKIPTLFFALNISDNGRVRLSSEGKGNLGFDTNTHYYDIPEFSQSTFYHLEINANCDGSLIAKVDGHQFISTYDAVYKGGYLGLCNYNANVEFKNVKYALRTIENPGNFEIPEIENYKVHDYRSGYTWANWTFDENTIIGSNPAIGDHFTMSTIKQQKNQNLLFEADVAMSGNSCGLTFGVTTISDPSGGWYNFAFSRQDKLVRCFAVNKGTIGTANESNYPLSSEELALDYFHMKIFAKANGFISLWLNGNHYIDLYDSQYDGGFIGFNTFYGSAEFTNIKVELRDNVVGIDDLNISDIGFEYNPSVQGYVVEADNKTKNVNINVSATSRQIIKINEIEGKALQMALKGGRDRVTVYSEDKVTGKSGYVDVLIKTYYAEAMRPAIHFTPKENWMNDPNGLMYDEETGKYHMFFQYSTNVNNSGDIDWGHAESYDLVNWVDKGIAIKKRPEWGVAFSGSGVIDRNNTSGLFDESVPAASRMCCIVTYHGSNPKIGLAYSTDQGATWKNYSAALIDNTGNMYTNNFRDPKVIWYQDDVKCPDGIWLMVTGGWTVVRLFASHNLLNWELQSEFKDIGGSPINSECPDFFPLPVNDDASNTKWVLSTGGTGFVVGDLNVDKSGKYYFEAQSPIKNIFDTTPLWYHVGEAYATQSYYNDKLNRRILVSWMIDRTANDIDGKTWNGAQTVPMETKLIFEEGAYELTTYPIQEITDQRGEELYSVTNKSITSDDDLVIDTLTQNLYDLELDFTCHTGKVAFELAAGEGTGITIQYDSSTNKCDIGADNTEMRSYGVYNIPMKHYDGHIKIRAIVDISAFEIFANGGRTTTTGLFNVPSDSTLINVSTSGSVTINKLTIYSLKPIH